MILSEYKVVVEKTVRFYDLPLHPDAVKCVFEAEGRRTVRVLRRAAVEATIALGPDVVAKFDPSRPWPQEHCLQSLSPLAPFWPVRPKLLQRAETDAESDLFSQLSELIKDPTCLESRLDESGYVLIHKSIYDHQVWGIDGERVLIPLQVTLWGTIWDLAKSAAHQIYANPCRQNFSISGHELLDFTVDLVALGAQVPKDCPAAHWLKDNRNEVLGLTPFVYKDALVIEDDDEFG